MFGVKSDMFPIGVAMILNFPVGFGTLRFLTKQKLNICLIGNKGICIDDESLTYNLIMEINFGIIVI